MPGTRARRALTTPSRATPRRRLQRALSHICSKPTTSIPTPEATPGGGETVYALTKVDQERLVLLWGKQTGIPTVALRYSCTYGPRQSLLTLTPALSPSSARACLTGSLPYCMKMAARPAISASSKTSPAPTCSPPPRTSSMACPSTSAADVPLACATWPRSSQMSLT